MRARPATIFADSIRQTASIAAWVAEFTLAVLSLQLSPERLLARDELGRQVSLEVGRLLHLADLDHLVVRAGAALRPLDRLLARLHLDHPVAAEHLLRLGEGAVGDLGLAALEGHARAHRRRMQAFAREHDARLLQVLV